VILQNTHLVNNYTFAVHWLRASCQLTSHQETTDTFLPPSQCKHSQDCSAVQAVHRVPPQPLHQCSLICTSCRNPAVRCRQVAGKRQLQQQAHEVCKEVCPTQEAHEHYEIPFPTRTVQQHCKYKTQSAHWQQHAAMAMLALPHNCTASLLLTLIRLLT
jgi:hypothetical protein